MSTSSSSSSLTSLTTGGQGPQHQQHSSSSSTHNTPYQGEHIVRQTPPSSWAGRRHQQPQRRRHAPPLTRTPPLNYSSLMDEHEELPPPPSSSQLPPLQAPVAAGGSAAPYSYQTPRAAPVQPPLVLDPSAASASAASSFSRSSSNSNNSTSSMRKILQAAVTGKKRGTPGTHGGTNDRDRFYHATPPPHAATCQRQQQPTAASFARTAPRAGFLSKLGTNIPEFKRRFFVLKPSTHLYYFMSPNDIEPRGCIDLEHVLVQEQSLIELPDGRCRFAIVLVDTMQHSQSHQQQQQQIVLEARSKAVALQWMQSLQHERLDTCQQRVKQLEGNNAQCQARIRQLQQELEHCKLVERDRDGALEDAANWKSQFDRLNEGLRLLTQHLRRPPPATSAVDAAVETTTNGNGNPVSSVHSDPHGGGDHQSHHGEKNNHDNAAQDDLTTGNPSVRAAESVNEREVDDESGGDGDSNETMNVASSAKDSSSPTTTNDVTPQSTNKTRTLHKRSSSSSSLSPVNVSHRETSLLDEIGDDEQQIDDLQFPGTHFSALLNACQQLRENHRLASVEASSAVEDLTTANEKVIATEKRMVKAEKHICKLWEDNCAMRKTLKQTKAEKRVLVKEVKSLMSVVNDTSQKLRDMSVTQDDHGRSSLQSLSAENDDDGRTHNFSPTEEERLIDELEEHVMTSIRLHEQFLGVNSGLADQLLDSVKKIDSGTYADNDDETSELASRPSSRFSQATESSATIPVEQEQTSEGAAAPSQTFNTSMANSTDTGTDGSAPLSPIRPTLLSLLDDDDDEEEDESVQEDAVDEEGESGPPSVISSVGAEFGDSYEELNEHVNDGESIMFPAGKEAVHPRSAPQIPSSIESYPAFAAVADDEKSLSLASTDGERKHPILQLDEEVADESSAPNLCASSTQSESSKSVVTDNGNATSRLFCPLADVVGARRREVRPAVDPNAMGDGKVYHLTFYSRKIGLQFQKVPAVPSSRGVLTEAMTADLPTADRGGDSASADLRRIAAISSMANNNSTGSSHNKSDEVCQVATPVDAVLVCGFHGFMDQTNQTRPKLGARLVAFDGVSVEVGKWTFDSVRKAIQARGRPLTLSFRNDFLTTKQRAILTRAVADVEKAIPPPRRTIQYKHTTTRPPSAEPESIVSTVSHESDLFVNDAHPLDDDDLSVSVASSNLAHTFGKSSAISACSQSVGSYQNFRSFSEAGSSSVFSSTSILVGNLMNGLSKKKSGGGVPQYLQSKPESSLENAPHHQDFTSSLL